MKLAVAGKGGVGKTTLCSLLAMTYAHEGKNVIAIDADPDANLASALGISPEEAEQIVPIVELKALIEERTGAKPGTTGGFFKLNPRVDDIPDRFSLKKDNVRLMVMGSVKGGGSGCACPESALLRSLMSHLLVGRTDVVVMDMEAGLEHLARGTAKAVDAFLIVVEPGLRSVQTAESIKRLAGDLDVPHTFVVGSKTSNDGDRAFIRENLPEFEILGFINRNPEIEEADRKGVGIFESSPIAAREVKTIKDNLEMQLNPT